MTTEGTPPQRHDVEHEGKVRFDADPSWQRGRAGPRDHQRRLPSRNLQPGAQRAGRTASNATSPQLQIQGLADDKGDGAGSPRSCSPLHSASQIQRILMGLEV